MNSQIKHHTARLRELLKCLLSPKLSPKLSKLPVRMAILAHRNLAQNFTLSLSDTFLLTYALKKKKKKNYDRVGTRKKISLILPFMIPLPAFCPSSSPYINYPFSVGLKGNGGTFFFCPAKMEELFRALRNAN